MWDVEDAIPYMKTYNADVVGHPSGCFAVGMDRRIHPGFDFHGVHSTPLQRACVGLLKHLVGGVPDAP